MKQIRLNVDNKTYEVNVDKDTPLLWVLRDELGFLGTKYGCGVGECGCCSVLIDNKPVKSCVTTASSVDGKKILTIESKSDKTMQEVKKEWIRDDVAQCGYCQSGQIISATGLLKSNKRPKIGEIKEFMSRNICRCGTYDKIENAIIKISKK